MDGGEAIVQALRDLGVDCVFSSPGSEWGPVWEAFARQQAGSAAGPRFFNCGHETLAVDLALGYTLASGRMQAVLLHAGAGLQHGSMAISSALASATPMIVMSGECLSYGDDPDFDPGAQWYAYLGTAGGLQRLIEPCVKWAQQAASAATLREMVIRAGEIAQREPAGPAYLSVPVEALAKPWSAAGGTRRVPAAPKHCASVADIENAASRLLAARNPVIATESAGRERAGYERLGELAELLGVPVVESPFASVSNFARDNELHQGFEPGPLVGDADLVVNVRSRVPWYPPSRRPGGFVIALDESPFKTYMAYQSLQADLYLEGDVPGTLAAICELVRARSRDEEVIRARKARWADAHRRSEALRREALARARESNGIQAADLCATLGAVLPADTVYVDETTSHRGTVHRFLPSKGHLGFVRTPSGLGQGLGLSLGIKLASPERPVACLLGDGALLYNPVVPALAFSAAAKMPVLAVVCNNRAYQSMKRNQLQGYPDGAGARHHIFPGGTLHGAEYHELARAFGAVGIEVREAAKLRAALEEGYAAVRSGTTAIVNVLLEA